MYVGPDSTSDTEEEAQNDGEESLEEVSSDEEEIRPYQFEPELDENATASVSANAISYTTTLNAYCSLILLDTVTWVSN